MNSSLIDQLDEGNLVKKLDKLEKTTRSKVYEDIMDSYTEASKSMDAWKRKYTKALLLAKMQPSNSKGEEIETKDFPFEGASTVMLPFILEAMLDFSARATPELVWNDKLVSVKITGQDREAEQAKEAQQGQPPSEEKPLVKALRAERVETFLNYQLANEIPGWRRGQDKNVIALPCVGTTYKKTYYDYEAKKVCSDLRMADKVVFDMACDTFQDAPDKFEPLKYSRNEVIGFIRGDQSWDLDEDDLEDEKNDFEFIEAHCWIDLDEDGLKEPYCAILDEESSEIVCLYPDYDEDLVSFNDKDEVVKIKDKETYTQYIFLPDPEGGPMGMGWGILLGPMFAAINTLVRQNIDAGTLNLTTSNSGLIAQNIGDGRGNRQLSSQVDIKMAQLTPYPMGGLQGSLRDNVVQFPFAGPSSVLMELTSYLVDTARNLASSAYSVEANAGEAAELYLARLQQGLKVPNSITMRVYEAAKEEFQKIALLDYKHHDSDLYNKVLDEPDLWIMQRDFNPDDCDIDLVADPSQGSDIERIAKAQNAYSMAMEQVAAGQNVMNLRQACIDLLEAQKVPNIEELVPEPDPNPSPEMQKMLALEAFEAELQDRGLKVKEREVAIKESTAEVARLKQAHEAARELSELGLQADIDESVITKNYADALAKLVKDTGISYEKARSEVIKIERDFIEESNGRQIPASVPTPDRPMAG